MKRIFTIAIYVALAWIGTLSALCQMPCEEMYHNNMVYGRIDQFVEMEKFYIHPSNIYFSSHQIFVKISEDLIPIQQIFCDDNGIYTTVQDIEAGRGRRATWICPKCGYENFDGINHCGLCGTNRYD